MIIDKSWNEHCGLGQIPKGTNYLFSLGLEVKKSAIWADAYPKKNEGVRD